MRFLARERGSFESHKLIWSPSWFLETCLATLATSGCSASILATTPGFSPNWLWCPLRLTILSLLRTHCSCLNEALVSAGVFPEAFWSIHSLPRLFPLLSRQVWESHFWNLAPTVSRRLPEGLVPSRLFPPPLSPPSHLLPHACPSFGFGLGLDRMGWRSPAAPSRRLFVRLSLPDWPGRWVNSCVGTKATMLAL